MEVKLFEVRDRMTFIPVVAVLMRPTDGVIGGAAERYLLGRDNAGEDVRETRAADGQVLEPIGPSGPLRVISSVPPCVRRSLDVSGSGMG
jgi:hypothetical protein